MGTTTTEPNDLTQRCRVFYERRLQVAERFRAARLPADDDGGSSSKQGHTLDRAMTQLRKEIATLMNEDNALFQQLLNLNDKIEELKEQQQTIVDDDDEAGSRCGSLESLSDAEEGGTADQSASPTSTLSSSSSSTTRAYAHFLRPQSSITLRRTNITFHREVARPLQIVTKDASGRLVLLRTYNSNNKESFVATSDSVSAYDSGFHGSESDPENNEIFV